MKSSRQVVLSLLICTCAWAGTASAATTAAPPTATEKQGMEAVKALTKITGVALSPLLGVGAVGLYDRWAARNLPAAEKAKLPWYTNGWFIACSLLLVASVAAKDAFGAVLPPGLKKPLDVAETIESKVSGLVAAGAFVPIVAAVFHTGGGGSVSLGNHNTLLASMMTMDFTPLLNVLTIPFAVAAFALVWLLGHVINVLILISPIGAVDAALKSLRTALMGGLVIVHHINPWVGALLSLIIIAIAYFIAGWSFRMMVFGSVFTWDFVTRRRKRFHPAPNANWMFTAHKLDKTPIRTYGKLIRDDQGKLTFAYRPWLFLPQRTVAVPAGQYAIGRGLFYPDLLLIEGQKERCLMSLPPRYKKHEEAVGKVYGIADIRDTGVLKGIKAFWRWCTSSVFGKDSSETAALATA